MTKTKEIWLEIPGYEGAYEASNLGQIRSMDREVKYIKGGKEIVNKYKGKVLTPTFDKDGYRQVTMKKTVKVHRIVAKAFLPNPENKATVNHIDGIKDNNNISNIEWATFSENANHKYSVLNRGRGEEHGKTTLTEDQVRAIKVNKDNLKGVELAEIYGVTSSAISSIKHGKNWGHVLVPKPTQLDLDSIIVIREEFKLGESAATLAEIYGVGEVVIEVIVRDIILIK